MKLGELILMRKTRTAASYRELSTKAKANGHTITSGTIHKMATEPLVHVPSRAVLSALACALDVTVEEVALAAVESMDIHLSPQVTNQSRARGWLTLVEGRSDDEVARLLQVAATVVDALDAVSLNGASASPGDQLHPLADGTAPHE